MSIGNDTYATRRHLPHLQKPGRTYFVTFVTRRRFELSSPARDVVLQCCLHDHQLTYWLDTVVVMPDHVHLLFTPYEEWPLHRIMQRIKGVSARLVNQALDRRGTVWEEESFDRILRTNEDVRAKGEYIAANPVRKGLVARPEDYRCLWQQWKTDNPVCQ